MAVSPSYLAFVLEQLEGIKALTHKRMFGGVGLYDGVVFFAVIDNDTLFFKVDDALRERYQRRDMPPFAPIPGKPAMLGYYQVPAEVLEDGDALCRWAADSIAVGAAASKPRRKKASHSGAGKTPARTRRHR
jgi:DNA transformation protein and related proteins